MEQLDYIKSLYGQYVAKTISAEDHNKLMTFFRTGSDDELQYVIGQIDPDEAIDENLISPYDQRSDQVLESIRKRTMPHVRRYASRSMQRWVTAAAAVLVFVFIGYYVFDTLYPAREDQQINTVHAADILPGGNKATLTLANGQEIPLHADKEGILTVDGSITYADGENVASSGHVQTVRLATPIAGQYQVELPDGSKAWLNAQSSISYPTRFVDGQRKIAVTGEVYLEVAKDATKRFIVATANQEIEVLGTTFNVNAYADNGRLYTTLVEGKLKVKTAQHAEGILLDPGQQAAISSDLDIAVSKVDVSGVVSWKDGFYLVEDQPLSVFSKQLERWYDVDIDMKNKGDVRLSAMVPRDINLSEVLQAIEIKTGITFNMEGRRITAK